MCASPSLPLPLPLPCHAPRLVVASSTSVACCFLRMSLRCPVSMFGGGTTVMRWLVEAAWLRQSFVATTGEDAYVHSVQNTVAHGIDEGQRWKLRNERKGNKKK